MNKQTVVEWLYQLSKERELDKFDLEQAKRMEKEQMMQFAKMSYDEGYANIPKVYVREYYKTENNGK